MNAIVSQGHFLDLIGAHITKRAGFLLDARKKRHLADFLKERCGTLGLHHFADYYDFLLSPDGDGREFARLMNFLTIQESFFFRHKAQFDVLKNVCLPSRIRAKGNKKTIHIWSAGCARGEEAYSIAMLVREVIPDAGSRVHIKATDINLQALKDARRAVYRKRAVRDMDAHYLTRWFTKHEAGYALSPEIRNMVDFEYLNLSELPLSMTSTPTWDIIFCRNVIIYFTPESNRNLMKRLYTALLPGGFLFSGFSETMRYLNEDFIPIQKNGAFIYQKPLPHQPHPTPSRIKPSKLKRKRTFPVKANRKIFNGPGKPDIPSKEIPPSPAPEPQDPMALAAKLVERGETVEAAEILNTIICEDPLNAKAYLMLALIYRNAGNPQGALNYFKKVTYLDPQNPLARLHLADLFNEMSEEKSALREYANVVLLLKNRPDLQKETFGDGFTGETLLTAAQAHLNRMTPSANRAR